MSEIERIKAIQDPFTRLRAATSRLAASGEEVAELSRLRRSLVLALITQGRSHAEIATAAGLSRGRISQILR